MSESSAGSRVSAWKTGRREAPRGRAHPGSVGRAIRGLSMVEVSNRLPASPGDGDLDPLPEAKRSFVDQRNLRAHDTSVRGSPRVFRLQLPRHHLVRDLGDAAAERLSGESFDA